ncbi:MAG: ABC transporter ATP-binding protein [Chlamydiae bacterium]|nr:ABC transporter ATP-binding protein [Chlamydiota bacterium]
MSSVLNVQNLRKVYGKKKPFVAVDNVSFQLKEGEILGLLGPNGSGKTTTIQVLLGTLQATSGTIEYFGKDFSRHRSKIAQHLSFASTYTSLPHFLTVEENLHFFGLLYSIKNIRKKTEPLLERFGILDKKHAPVASLSAGQITRLVLVKAFFTEPKIVLLDEPTASLDPDISQDVCKFILEEREKRGISILFTSHKMEEVAELCDRTIFLKNGKIIADDLPENLAKSVSSYELRLTVIDGMKRLLASLEKQKISFVNEHRTIQLSLEEKQLPLFLQELIKLEISYTNIQIKEPSLEDYFLKIAEKNQ